MLTQKSTHAASLTHGEILERSDLGSLRRLTADSFPILKGMSMRQLLISPGAMRTPHWHANANEMTYCVSGSARVSILDIAGGFTSFVVGAGDVFHVDAGALHHIENIAGHECEFIITLRNERPEDFGLGAAFEAAALGNTHGVPDAPATAYRLLRRPR